jgi:hypothetical protein
MKKLKLMMPLGAILLFATFACKEKETVIPIPEGMKPYIMFPNGSYWIYQDSLSGAIDSVFLYGQSTSLGVTSSHEDIYFEQLGQVFYLNGNRMQTVGTYCSDVGNYIYYVNYMGAKFIDSIPVDSYFQFGDSLKRTNTYTTYEFNGLIFHDVIEMSQIEMKTLWCVGVGVIRHEKYEINPKTLRIIDTLKVNKLLKYKIKTN